MLGSAWALVASALILAGSVWYAIDVWRGQARPNLVSWGLWSLAPAIALAAQLSQGVGIEALLTFSIGFGPLIIIVTALVRRQSQWKPSRFDYVCGCTSVVALILWRLTGDGTWAITFALLADLLAAMPTVAKSYLYPKTESAGAFWLGVLAAIINLLVLTDYSYATAGVTVYVLIINLALAVLISFPHVGRPLRVPSGR